jgi:hypothetical protein
LVKAKKRVDIIYEIIRWELMFGDIGGQQKVCIFDKQKISFQDYDDI